MGISQTIRALAKELEVNWTQIKEECQSETKVSQLISNIQLPLRKHIQN